MKTTNKRKVKTTVKQGRTRIKPIPVWKTRHANVMKRVKRLGRKVTFLGKNKEFPKMAFVYFQGGKLHSFGNEQLCKGFAINKDSTISSALDVKEEDAQKTVDLRLIDLNITFENENIDTLRKMYAQLNFNKGIGERGTYSESRRPTYWPTDVPFVSHSKRKEVGKGRIITSECMVRCLDAFRADCIQKLNDGYTPVHVCQSFDVDLFMKKNGNPQPNQSETSTTESSRPPTEGGSDPPPEAGSDQPPETGSDQPPEAGSDQPPEAGPDQPPEAGSDQPPAAGTHQPPEAGSHQPPEAGSHQPPEVGTDQPPEAGSHQPPAAGSDQPPEHQSERNEQSSKQEEIETPLETAIRKSDYLGLIDMILRNEVDDISKLKTSIHLGDISLNFEPRKKVMRSYKGPDTHIPGKGNNSLWEMFGEFPDILKLGTYLFFIEHRQHYLEQYLNMDLLSVKKAFQNQGSTGSVDELLEEEARHMLTDLVPGPAALMMLTGFINKEMKIYNEAGAEDHFTVCPCNEHDVEVMRIYIDKGQCYYPLSLKSLWIENTQHTRHTQHSSDKTISPSKSDRGCLPGLMKTDGVLFQRYGLDIWQGEVDRVVKGQWIDDNIVNIMLRFFQEGHEDIHVMDTSFAQKLLLPDGCENNGGRLRFTACEIQKVKAYTRRVNIKGKKMIIFPICDNTHWILGACVPHEKAIKLMCSMGGTYNRIGANLIRYFQTVLETKDKFHIEYPIVPKQQNGQDCGLFVIKFAECLIKGFELKSLRVNGRESIMKTIRKWF